MAQQKPQQMARRLEETGLHEGAMNKLMMRELRRINQRIFATEVFYFEMRGFQSLVSKLG